MKNRLFYKFFISSSIAIITSFLVIMILLSISVNSYFVKEKETVLLDNCKTISEVLSKETDNTANFYVSLNGVIRVVSNAVSGDAYVCDSEGNVFLCSCSEWKNYSSCAHSKGVIDESIRDSASKKGKYFEIGSVCQRKLHF